MYVVVDPDPAIFIEALVVQAIRPTFFLLTLGASVNPNASSLLMTPGPDVDL